MKLDDFKKLISAAQDEPAVRAVIRQCISQLEGSIIEVGEVLIWADHHAAQLTNGKGVFQRLKDRITTEASALDLHLIVTEAEQFSTSGEISLLEWMNVKELVQAEFCRRNEALVVQAAPAGRWG